MWPRRSRNRNQQDRWLIVGLGNPGTTYRRTRHNLGARVVQAFGEQVGQASFSTDRQSRACVSRGHHILVVPITFMNESGYAVAALARKSAVPPARLLIVHDDKDLKLGKLKLQQGRSAAGHRGVKSVIDELGTQAFWRLRVGVGSPPANVETDTFVLSNFTKDEERSLAEDVIPRAVQLISEHLQNPGTLTREAIR